MITSLQTNMSLRNQRGFTIVELLIVIVIIAILFTIATVTAGGIQQRAVNTSMLATYHQVHKTLSARLVADGYFPITSAPPGSQICIGKTTDLNGDSVGDCDSWQEDGDTELSHLTHQSTSFDNGMTAITSNMPGRFSQPFTLHTSNEYGSGTTTTYNAILHTYTNVPPEQDPEGEVRLTTGQKVAYTFGGPLYGDNQDCGAHSVSFNDAFMDGLRIIVEYSPSQNEPMLSDDGMTYCLYAVDAI